MPTPTPLPQRTWQELITTHTPQAGGEYALAYDAGRGVLVLYGGNAYAWPYSNETWEFDGVDWTQVTTTVSPAARYDADMVYDATSGQVLLFGGSDQDDAANGETWMYDGANWTRQFPATSPPARSGHVMVSGETGDVYLFGGADGEAVYQDLWRYDGVTWSLVNAGITLPPPRTHTTLAFLPNTSQLLLYGGRDNSGQTLADTWLFDLNTNTWTPTGGLSPGPRQATALSYDAITGNAVLFGGLADDGDDTLADTWHYQPGSGWSLVILPTSPPASAFQRIAFDSANGYLILWTAGQTWRYQ